MSPPRSDVDAWDQPIFGGFLEMTIPQSESHVVEEAPGAETQNVSASACGCRRVRAFAGPSGARAAAGYKQAALVGGVANHAGRDAEILHSPPAAVSGRSRGGFPAPAPHRLAAPTAPSPAPPREVAGPALPGRRGGRLAYGHTLAAGSCTPRSGVANSGPPARARSSALWS